MTLVSYCNALREMGGARRLIEDEVRNGLFRSHNRKRIGPGSVSARTAAHSLGAPSVMSPSRLQAGSAPAKVSEAKRKLGLQHAHEEHVDVAIASGLLQS